MSFDQRKSTDNWAEVGWDREVWIPVPLSFQGTKWPDAAEWATDWAGERVMRAHGELTKKLMKKEVVPRAQALVRGRAEIAGNVAAHKIYFHCPDTTKTPVATFIGLWKCQGTREEALQFYGYYGTKSATIQPEAEWFKTEALGTGIKAHWTGVTGPGQYWQADYAFRDDEFDTDVQVFMMAWDQQRFAEVVPDLDNLVRSIRCVPSSSKSN
ncbi:hypothetical protein NGB36_18730 [Streptomyces sp. RB6PN25]|uniref:Uncharacterized protein n=1 Tax=Streptomyces humicola TaxID=2953240 RepID=A0ABT1Q1G3_9ACTN|nr:hypothetical protein [Streptomyces humicola]MCQ4082582.1 hypothetical protein [Streptomyces humicola]